MFQQLQNSVDDRKFEEIIFDTLNNGLAKKFWLQCAGEVLHTTRYIQGLTDCWNKLGTLGAARGKLILLQRFNYQFRSSPSNPFGVHLDAEQWTPNGRDIKLIFNTEPKRLAYIQVSMQAPFVHTTDDT
jgi:hypothetical protein